MNWVSVNERLPEDGQGVLVYLAVDGIFTRKGLEIGHYDTSEPHFSGGWWVGDGIWLDNENLVTHWMPLPPPPVATPSEGEKRAA